MRFYQSILPDAQADFDKGVEWYAKEKNGLGKRFGKAVKEVLKGLRRLPNRHGIVFKDIRRAMVKGFPYAIFYRVVKQEVFIISIFHCSQDPSEWQSRV